MPPGRKKKKRRGIGGGQTERYKGTLAIYSVCLPSFCVTCSSFQGGNYIPTYIMSTLTAPRGPPLIKDMRTKYVGHRAISKSCPMSLTTTGDRVIFTARGCTRGNDECFNIFQIFMRKEMHSMLSLKDTHYPVLL